MPLPITRGAASAIGFGLFGGGGGGLFPFTTFTFTSVGVSGSTGPTSGQFAANSSYNTALWYPTYFSTTNGVQFWTVPVSGTYELVVAGADGISGISANTANGYGRGAIITATVSLVAGQQLRILVGQKGVSQYSASSGSYNDGQGAGGSAVSIVGGNLLVVAGGGGGVTDYSTVNNQLSSSNASLTTTVPPWTDPKNAVQSTYATGGNGGYASPTQASDTSQRYTGGGGGWNTDGQQGNQIYSGYNMATSAGSALSSNTPNGGSVTNGTYTNSGGFGGGSAAQGGYSGSGAGGGYNGGNGGDFQAGSSGLGGASYVGGGATQTAATNRSSGSPVNGSIQITKLS